MLAGIAFVACLPIVVPDPASRPDASAASRAGDPRLPRPDKRSLLQRLIEFIRPGPDSREELTEALADAEDNAVINAETRVMLDGVIRLSDLTAGDVMVAAPRMDVIDIDAPFEAMLNQIIETGHSRFPVIQGDRDNIIGILLAKDLLKLQRAPELNLRALLRPATFVPESKALNDLLREFRGNRNHLAVVVDEFGRVAGIITIEDVLEEIVGEIEDEFDVDADQGDIFGLADKTYRVSGDTPLDAVREAFGDALVLTDNELDFDTIGGLISHEMGHVPRRGESHTLGGLRFVVLHTKGGLVRWFKVTPAAADESATNS